MLNQSNARKTSPNSNRCGDHAASAYPRTSPVTSHPEPECHSTVTRSLPPRSRQWRHCAYSSASFRRRMLRRVSPGSRPLKELLRKGRARTVAQHLMHSIGAFSQTPLQHFARRLGTLGFQYSIPSAPHTPHSSPCRLLFYAALSVGFDLA
jgi:hypothetical protein